MRPIAIRVLVPVSLAVASVAAAISFYLGNAMVLTNGHWAPLWVWGVRVLVLVAALAAGWHVKGWRRKPTSPSASRRR